jgi:hypothetical protein
MSLNTVRNAIRDAMKVSSRYEDKRLTNDEANAIVKAAETGPVTRNEMNEVKGFLAKGIEVKPDTAMTRAVPELSGDSFYMGTDARSTLEKFLLGNEIKAAIQRPAPQREAFMSDTGAKSIVDTASVAGVSKTELDDVKNLLDRSKLSPGPGSLVTMAIPEIPQDMFYVSEQGKKTLEDFVMNNTVKSAITPNSRGEGVMTDAGARAIVGAAGRGGVSASEIDAVRGLLAKAVVSRPNTPVTLAIPEIPQDMFYVSEAGKQLLQDFVSRAPTA